MDECVICGKPLENEIWQVMIYESGKRTYVKTDCKDCADEMKEMNYEEYKSKANDIKNQCLQRLK